MTNRSAKGITLFSAADARRLLRVWEESFKYYGPYARNVGASVAPSVSQLRQLLNVAYEVSVLAEEGRFPIIRVLFQVAGGPILGPFNSKQLVASYAKARNFSAAELRKLAPSVNPRNSYLIVEAGASARAKLRIRGTGLSPIDDDERLAVDKYRKEQLLPFPYFVVEINGPSKLTLRSGSFVIARVSGRDLKLGATPIEAVHRTIKWRDQVASELRDRVQRYYERASVKQQYRSPTLLKDATIVVQVLINRFIRLVRELGHGALILVCDDQTSKMVLDGRAPIVQLVHRLSADDRTRLWRALAAAFDGEERLYAEIEEHKGREAGRTALEYGAVQLMLDGLDTAYRQLHRELEVLAHRANIDGALMISTKFDCLAFGCAVRDLAGVDPAIDVVSGPDPNDGAVRLKDKHYGTRHRAAFRFVDAHPESAAIIVSQDGDVKMCYRDGDRVVCHIDTFPPVAES